MARSGKDARGSGARAPRTGGAGGAGAPRTSAGEPARTVALLWRVAEPSRRGPRPRLDVDAVVGEAIALADEQGLAAVTMRALAARLGVSAMTLYGSVPGKEVLLDLMLDALYARMQRPAWEAGAGWRSRSRAVAEANRALYAAHPWAAAVSTARPPLGPGQMAKYEHELAAFDGAGLGDVERDSALSFLLAFVRGIAVAAADAEQSPGTDAEWWERGRCSPRSSPRSATRSPRASAPPRARPTAPPTTPRRPTSSGSSACSTASPRSSADTESAATRSQAEELQTRRAAVG